MKQVLVLAAMAALLAGCASNTTAPEQTASAAKEETSESATNRVCSDRDGSETGSRMKKRTCRTVKRADTDGS